MVSTADSALMLVKRQNALSMHIHLCNDESDVLARAVVKKWTVGL